MKEYTIEEVSEIAGVAVATVRRHIRRKRLRAKKVKVVEAAELRKYLLE